MKKLLVLVLLFLFLSLGQVIVFAQDDEETRSPSFSSDERPKAGGIIVKYKSNVTEENRKTTVRRIKNGEILINKRKDVGFDNYEAIETAEEEVGTTIEELKEDPNIESAEPDYYVQLYFTPNDPLYSKQWWLTKIQAPQAWDITKGSSSVLVAVVDTGVNTSHPDLKAKITKVMNTQKDEADHGTHLAGIIAATTNNSLGVAGAGFNVKLISADASTSKKGAIPLSEGIKGIKWAADNGASVINLSWGITEPCDCLKNAIQYAINKGIVIVAAAGNERNSKKTYPASYSGVVSVAATTSNDKLASFSTRGLWVDIAAPGVDILSTIGSNNYVSYAGTSMAAPIVTGVAALVKSAYPNYTAQQIADRLCSTADKIAGTGSKFRCGRVNAYKAVLGAVVPSPSPTPNPYQALNLKIRFQGITDKAKDQKITVSLLSGYSSKYSGTLTGTSDNNGLFSLAIDNSQGKITAGTYELKLKGTSHLNKKIQNLAYSGGGQSFDLTKQENQMLKAGDVNNDNKITIEDASQVLKYYTNFSVPVAANDAKMEASDINKDGFITIQDVALIAINWSDFAVQGDN